MSGKYGDQISQFSAGGKTFFFNEVEASNGRTFLGINTLWGKGNQERLVLFPDQVLPFREHFLEAFEEFTGLEPRERARADAKEVMPQIPPECPGCGADSWDYTVSADRPDQWKITCDGCEEVILKTEDEDGDV